MLDPTLGFMLGFSLGFMLGFSLGFMLGFSLGFSLDFMLGFSLNFMLGFMLDVRLEQGAPNFDFLLKILDVLVLERVGELLLKVAFGRGLIRIAFGAVDFEDGVIFVLADLTLAFGAVTEVFLLIFLLDSCQCIFQGRELLGFLLLPFHLDEALETRVVCAEEVIGVSRKERGFEGVAASLVKRRGFFFGLLQDKDEFARLAIRMGELIAIGNFEEQGFAGGEKEVGGVELQVPECE